ncbi:MAG: hypothetical protein GWP60_09660 [Gammaproteobacteria bacterium]|nr:hypothetical protein [Gammaproteobacteria bacterium]
MKQAWLGVVMGATLIYCTSITPASADPPDFSICDGLTGAAWGLCRGGVAAGCADGTGNPTACMAIEENYMSITGEDAPWITPPVTCPCDYLTDVPIDTAWDLVTTAVFNCAGDEAFFAAVLPLPQFPQVTAIRTTQDPPQPICQAVTSTGGNVREISEAELSVCRDDVIEYGLAAIAANPALTVNDVCSPLLP